MFIFPEVINYLHFNFIFLKKIVAVPPMENQNVQKDKIRVPYLQIAFAPCTILQGACV